MSDHEQATVASSRSSSSSSRSSSSSSQADTVRPVPADEGPTRPEAGTEEESPMLLDSSTLMCSSIDKSPAAMSDSLNDSQQFRCSDDYARIRTNSNQSEAKEATASSDSSRRSASSISSSCGGGGSTSSSYSDLAANQSAKSTVTDRLSSSFSERTNTNFNRGSGALEESATDDGEGANLEPDRTDSDPVTSTDATATGVRSTVVDPGAMTDSAFFNLTVTETTSSDRSGQSPRGNKGDLASLIERAILDFCSSRTVDTMRRKFAGVTNDFETREQRDAGRYEDRTATKVVPVTGDLVKEGIIIGEVDSFATRAQREFILPLKDSFIVTLLNEPSVFRAICRRTHCQIEVTRRLLNRKLCVGGSWQKFMILRIIGPTVRTIMTCDSLLRNAVPSYKQRKEYMRQAACRMFIREDIADNTDLYYQYQRTGGTSNRFGVLKLESPFHLTKERTVGLCPWKQGRVRAGNLAQANVASHLCMKHVYPDVGYQKTDRLEPEYQGVSAQDRIHFLHERSLRARQAALDLKQALTVSVCR